MKVQFIPIQYFLFFFFISTLSSEENKIIVTRGIIEDNVFTIFLENDKKEEWSWSAPVSFSISRPYVIDYNTNTLFVITDNDVIIGYDLKDGKTKFDYFFSQPTLVNRFNRKNIPITFQFAGINYLVIISENNILIYDYQKNTNTYYLVFSFFINQYSNPLARFKIHDDNYYSTMYFMDREDKNSYLYILYERTLLIMDLINLEPVANYEIKNFNINPTDFFITENEIIIKDPNHTIIQKVRE
jgi:hypothetical protein